MKLKLLLICVTLAALCLSSLVTSTPEGENEEGSDYEGTYDEDDEDFDDEEDGEEEGNEVDGDGKPLKDENNLEGENQPEENKAEGEAEENIPEGENQPEGQKGEGEDRNDGDTRNKYKEELELEFPPTGKRSEGPPLTRGGDGDQDKKHAPNSSPDGDDDDDPIRAVVMSAHQVTVDARKVDDIEKNPDLTKQLQVVQNELHKADAMLRQEAQQGDNKPPNGHRHAGHGSEQRDGPLVPDRDGPPVSDATHRPGDDSRKSDSNGEGGEGKTDDEGSDNDGPKGGAGPQGRLPRSTRRRRRR